MKKKYMVILLFAILLLPIQAFAAQIELSKYNTTNLEDTLKAEGITADLSNYKENDNQVVIYLFRGQGCAHCEEFLEYVGNTLIGKFNNNIKLVSFETWNDANNKKLLNTVAAFLGDEAGGVPYIVIGDKSFLGYATSINSEIEAAVTALVNSKNRYDVFEEINKEEKKGTNSNTVAVVLWNVAITSVGVGIVIFHNNSTKKQIIEELSKKSSKK